MPDAPTSRQRCGRRIALSPEELDDFLGSARTCRVATMNASGPHVSPLWFVWHEQALWLYSIVASQRFADLRADPRVAVVVDDGQEYAELRGVELSGRVETVGEVPRTGVDTDPGLRAVESAYASKYLGLGSLPHDERHAWLRLAPTKIVSWDFRKLASR